MPTVNISRTLVTFMYTLTICLCLEARIILAQGHLPKEEKDALQEIGKQLGKTDWKFDLNPCDGNQNWNTSRRPEMPTYTNSVICNCSYPDAVCHIEEILLKGQDLPGVLPPSLAKLPYLKMIDLNRNYLNGTIPPEWASIKLEFMSVSVNRLTGPIPKYLGNITTLTYLSLETNQFNGSVPAELGNLTSLVNLILSANNLTGELPLELNNLKELTEVRLSSNNFSGKLPSFQSWRKLEKLELQATGFEGPIPSTISVSTNLTELRISDLNVGASKFPQIGDMLRMSKLMLRSCNISGEIPQYLANLTELKHLDLSFNRLGGKIPNLEVLKKLENMYVTRNYPVYTLDLQEVSGIWFQALFLQKKGSLMELVDPKLGSNFNINEADKMIRVALLCTSPSPALRPTMSEVVNMLQGNIRIQEFNMDPSIYESELKLQAFREKYSDLYLDSSGSQARASSSLAMEIDSSSKSDQDTIFS